MIHNRKIITSSSFLAMLFLGVGYSLVGAAARNIGLTPAQIGLLLAAQNVGFAVAVAVAGALSDTLPKPRILLIGSILLAGGLLGFYVVPIFWVNVLVCVLIGLGIGAYEGATDALLFDLHGNRAGPYVNINHLCVTLGGALIALYVIFLDLLWRSAVVQAGLAVAADGRGLCVDPTAGQRRPGEVAGQDSHHHQQPDRRGPLRLLAADDRRVGCHDRDAEHLPG